MKFEFEKIDNYHMRAKVLGGWLVKAIEDVYHKDSFGAATGYDRRVAMAFVPDPKHSWNIGREKING